MLNTCGMKAGSANIHLLSDGIVRLGIEKGLDNGTGVHQFIQRNEKGNQLPTCSAPAKEAARRRGAT